MKSLDPNYFIEVSDATIYKPLIDDIVQEIKSNMHNVDEFIEFSKVNETDISSEENINKKKDEIEKTVKLPDMFFSKGFISKYKLDSNYEFTRDGGNKLVSDLRESIKKYMKKDELISNLSDLKAFVEYTNTIDKAYDDMYDILIGYWKKFINLKGVFNSTMGYGYFEKMNEYKIDIGIQNTIFQILQKIQSGYFTIVHSLTNILGDYVSLLNDMKDQSLSVYTIINSLKEDLKQYEEDTSAKDS